MSAAGGAALFPPAGMTLEGFGHSLIREGLRRAAGLLGLTRNALRYRLTQMGVADLESGG